MCGTAAHNAHTRALTGLPTALRARAQAVPRRSSLRTLELRNNGLALEVGDAFGRLLAGPKVREVKGRGLAHNHSVRSAADVAACGASPDGHAVLQPSRLTRRATETSGRGRYSQSLSGIGASTGVPYRASSPNLEASADVAALSGRSTDSGRGAAAPAPQPECWLASLDLGRNPLLGDVGVCKLAAGLAEHCRWAGGHCGRACARSVCGNTAPVHGALVAPPACATLGL